MTVNTNKIIQVHRQWRREWGMCPGPHWRGRHLERRKYGILKFDRFWRVVVCIEVGDILHPLNIPVLGLHPNCQCSTSPHKAVCTSRNLHWWSDWSFTSCKTVEYPYCPITVLLAVAIRCFALLTFFQIGIKFGNSVWNWWTDSQKKSLNLLQLMSDFTAKMHQIQFRLGLCTRPHWGNL